MPTNWHSLCDASELPRDGTGMGFDLVGRRIAVFWHESRPHAVDDSCPHEGASLSQGVISRSEVTCPWHSFHFDLETGKNADGLAMCVAVYPSRVSPGGRVEVQVASQRTLDAENLT